MYRTIISFIAGIGALLIAAGAQAELQSKTVEYEVDGESLTGYLVYDASHDGKRPGVLVVHEWWGHNDFARQEAEKLARAGYVAFALDMYGSGKQADHPEQAQAFMREATSDLEAMEARFRAAQNLLQSHQAVDSSRIAAQGYCFGGAVVLNMARLGLDLQGVVSFHGSLGSDISVEPGTIQAKIQVYNGSSDPLVPAQQVADFIEEMHAAEADVALRTFPGAMHAFMNPEADKFGEKFDMPLAYNENAAQRSWEGTLAFYREIFGE